MTNTVKATPAKKPAKVEPQIKTELAQDLLKDVDFLESLNSSNAFEQVVATKHFLEKALINAEEVFNDIRARRGRLDAEELAELFLLCVSGWKSPQQ